MSQTWVLSVRLCINSIEHVEPMLTSCVKSWEYGDEWAYTANIALGRRDAFINCAQLCYHVYVHTWDCKTQRREAIRWRMGKQQSHIWSSLGWSEASVIWFCFALELILLLNSHLHDWSHFFSCFSEKNCWLDFFGLLLRGVSWNVKQTCTVVLD